MIIRLTGDYAMDWDDLMMFILTAGSTTGKPRENRMRPLPLSQAQQMGQTGLMNLANKPYQPNKLQTQAEDMISQILSGGFDPFTSPYYNNMRSTMLKNQSGQAVGLKRQLNRGNNLYGTPANKRYSDFYSGTNQQILNLMSGVQEQERGRQFSAIPIASQLSKAEQEYNDTRAKLYQILLGQETDYYEPDYTPSPWSALTPLLTKLWGANIMGKTTKKDNPDRDRGNYYSFDRDGGMTIEDIMSIINAKDKPDYGYNPGIA